MKKLLVKLWVRFLRFALDPRPLDHEDHADTRYAK